MRITSLDIRNQKLKRRAFGYDTAEVDSLIELAAVAISDASKEINALTDELTRIKKTLYGHEEREEMLKRTITSAHEMAEGLKDNATRKAELLIAEARVKADKILLQANHRASDIQQEILQYKRQRIELERSIRSILDYHSNILDLGEKEATKADEELEKIKFITK